GCRPSPRRRPFSPSHPQANLFGPYRTPCPPDSEWDQPARAHSGWRAALRPAGFHFLGKRRHSGSRVTMYSRTYKLLVSVPPVLWVALFLLSPYALMFAHRLWS